MRLIQVVVTATSQPVTKVHINAGIVVLYGSGTCYVGDNTVTSANGIPVPTGTATPLTLPQSDNRIPLYELYVVGAGNLNILWN